MAPAARHTRCSCEFDVLFIIAAESLSPEGSTDSPAGSTERGCQLGLARREMRAALGRRGGNAGKLVGASHHNTRDDERDRITNPLFIN